MRHRKTSFVRVVERLEARNAYLLMQKARIANRLAKALEGRARNQAYRVKHEALLAIVNHVPGQVTVSQDEKLPDMLVVGVASEKFGLHVPASYFSRGKGKGAA